MQRSGDSQNTNHVEHRRIRVKAWRVRSRRDLNALGLSVLLCVLLAGCSFDGSQSVQINQDGSGKLVEQLTYDTTPAPCNACDPDMRKAIDQQAQQLLTNFDADMQQFADKVVAEGGTSKKDTSGSQATIHFWTFTRPFTSIDQFNQFAHEVPKSLTGYVALMLHADQMTQKSKDGGTTLTTHLTGSIAMNKQGDFPIAVSDSVTVMLPGATTAVGGQQSATGITYALKNGPQAEQQAIDVTGTVTTSPPSPPSSPYRFPCTAVLLPVLVGLATFLIRRARA